MFSDTLKSKITNEFSLMFSRSKLVSSAQQGFFTERQLVVYLRNLEHLFFQNAEQMLQASQLYKSKPVLSKFFHSKWVEERGHDRWAKADQENFKSVSSLEKVVLPEMSELTFFLEETMRNCPYSYLAYFFYAEFMTAQIGPKWMKIIQAALNIKKNNVSSLNNHILLDGDHASEVLDFLDEIEVPESKHENILHFTGELTTRYESFFEAIWRLEENEKSSEVT